MTLLAGCAHSPRVDAMIAGQARGPDNPPYFVQSIEIRNVKSVKSDEQPNHVQMLYSDGEGAFVAFLMMPFAKHGGSFTDPQPSKNASTGEPELAQDALKVIDVKRSLLTTLQNAKMISVDAGQTTYYLYANITAVESQIKTPLPERMYSNLEASATVQIQYHLVEKKSDSVVFSFQITSTGLSERDSTNIGRQKSRAIESSVKRNFEGLMATLRRWRPDGVSEKQTTWEAPKTY
jgi:hypothetical protein